VVGELGGRKSLYSTSFYSREEFARLYGGSDYERLRAEYDPDARLVDLWTKTVARS
jgi:FAD/FMN-containing dehydrogenase